MNRVARSWIRDAFIVFSDFPSNPDSVPIVANDRVNWGQPGCIFLGESKNGFVISDNLDHGASKEPTNPSPEWIRQFL